VNREGGWGADVRVRLNSKVANLPNRKVKAKPVAAFGIAANCNPSGQRSFLKVTIYMTPNNLAHHLRTFNIEMYSVVE